MSAKYLLVLFVVVVLLTTHSLAQYKPPGSGHKPPIYKRPPAEEHSSVDTEKAFLDAYKPPKGKGGKPPHKPGHPPVVDAEDGNYKPPVKKPPVQKPPPKKPPHKPPSSD
ncbi:hypothetical protein P3X46_006286 [Hevea brasiliensis]|uniref:Uncharacterized protein n=1 Tax=Hevea brasiliensis TaxID=3981 RepID=A0ABQ9MT12_HEVBR|nr:repetitive proline-rich cell wall protein 2 [Hevea brasiliensis]KAJ9182271.1 hypothetical protein P3X46_006286 [Hevea brasiliensis]